MKSEIKGYLLCGSRLKSFEKDIFIQAIEQSGMAQGLTGNTNRYDSGSLIINSSDLSDSGYSVVSSQADRELILSFSEFIAYLIAIPELSDLDFRGHFKVVTPDNNDGIITQEITVVGHSIKVVTQ